MGFLSFTYRSNKWVSEPLSCITAYMKYQVPEVNGIAVGSVTMLSS